MEKKIARFVNKGLLKFGLYLQKSPKEKQKEILANNADDAEAQNFKSQNQWLEKIGIKTVLDIGANDGQFAEKIDTILPEANKICFEPLNEPFEKLKNRFKEKKCFSFFRLALGNTEGTQNIFRNEYSPSSSILKMKSAHKEAFDFAREEFEETIEIKKLDNLAKDINIESPYLVKIDVQGFEIEVIKGGIETIGDAEMVILETSFIQLYEGAPLFGDIYRELNALGFEYAGSFEQLSRPSDGKILQQDSIFQKKNK